MTFDSEKVCRYIIRFQNVKYTVSTARSMEGDIGGYIGGQFGKYRNTMSKIDEIPKVTKYRYRIPFRVFVYLCMHQKSTSDIARKCEKTLISRMIEKPGHWMPFQFCHRLCNHLALSLVFKIILPFINLFSLLLFLLHIVLICIRQESANKWYCNTVKDLLLPKLLTKRMKNHILQAR